MNETGDRYDETPMPVTTAEQVAAVRAERSLEAAGDRMEREKCLHNAKKLLGAAMDALELAPASGAALIPKAHAWARKFVTASGDEGEG